MRFPPALPPDAPIYRFLALLHHALGDVGYALVLSVVLLILLVLAVAVILRHGALPIP
jgi:hypothetical protein